MSTVRTTVGFLFVLVVAAGAEPGSLGLIHEDLRFVPGVVEVTRVPVAPGRPAADAVLRVDHSAEMPPVGNQGAQGSCVAWAHGYYQKTHTEFLEHRWNVADPHNQMSTAFLYNQVCGGADRGTGGSVVMKLMCEQGCASMADCPYNDHDCNTWPSESAYDRGLSFRADQSCWIAAGDTAGINDVRQHIANGYTCVLGIQVWANFDNISMFRYTYCSSERYGTMRGWHAVTAVGYDDTLTTSDGPGAFRMVNSWGTGWGDNGYFWMSYVAVMDAMMSGRQMEFASDRIGYEPHVVGRVTISHATRDRVGIAFAVGTSECQLWRYDFRTWRTVHVDQPFPSHPMVFDLTDGEDYLHGGPGESLLVGCTDNQPEGTTGAITFFAGEHRPWNTRGVSMEVPVLIPDDGSEVYARVHLAQTGQEERSNVEFRMSNSATIARGVFSLPGLGHDPISPSGNGSCPALLDAAGRSVLALHPGANDVSGLAPGVYFVRRAQAQAQAVSKLVVLR